MTLNSIPSASTTLHSPLFPIGVLLAKQEVVVDTHDEGRKARCIDGINANLLGLLDPVQFILDCVQWEGICTHVLHFLWLLSVACLM